MCEARHAEARAWIRDLQPGCSVEERYVVRSKEMRQRRNGGRYLALSLGDRTGVVSALAWENLDRIAQACSVGSVVTIRGQTQRYKQHLQVVIRHAESVPQDSVDESLFVRSSEIDPQLLWSRLTSFIEGIGDPDLRQLVFRVFADPEVTDRFKGAPAARGMHHAFRSGLLEHTVSMATAARQLARHYRLDEDMVVAGTILHDLGKIWELEISSSIEYTDDGRLLGHLPLAVLHVEGKINELSSFPEELRRQLLHILLAHHGAYEYGSPRRPKTPEALLVHMVDNLDSRMSGMLEVMQRGGETGEAWSEYSRILERQIYLRRPPTRGEKRSGEHS